MPESLPYMPFYGDDFFGSERVAAMTGDEEALYMRMLWLQWTKGTCPDDPEMVAKLARFSPKIARKAWQKVRENFTECEEKGRVYNVKLAQIQHGISGKPSSKKAIANRLNGTKGGRPKKEPSGFSVGSEKETQNDNPKDETQKGNAREKQNQIITNLPTFGLVDLGFGKVLFGVFADLQCVKNCPSPETQEVKLAEIAAKHPDFSQEQLLELARETANWYRDKVRYSGEGSTESVSAVSMLEKSIHRRKAWARPPENPEVDELESAEIWTPPSEVPA